MQVLFNKLCGIVFVVFGVYSTLIGYSILPINPKDPGRSELLHRKFGKMMRILGPIIIIGGILFLVGVL